MSDPFQDKVKIVGASNCQIAYADNDSEQKSGKQGSILRASQRFRMNCSNPSATENSKPDSGTRKPSLTRRSFLTWASSVMKKKDSALSTDSFETKSQHSSFWTR
jgi:hypothetical protein